MKTIKKASAIILALVLVLCTFAACSLFSPEKKLLGAWSDNAGVVGFEFKENNVVTVGANIIPGIRS